MKEASDNTNNYAEFFIVYDRVNWLLSGHDANEWDEYQEILAATRRERGDRLYEVNFDLAKYQEWLGDRKNSFALQKEWAQYMAFAPKPLPLEQLVANYDKKFPRFREAAEATWLKNRAILPPRMFLSMDTWREIAKKLEFNRGDFDVLEYIAFIALTTWRFSKQIYRFDPTLSEALIATPTDTLQGEALGRLSAWCVYVECPIDLGIFGYFAFLDESDEGDSLILVYHLQDNTLFAVPNLFLHGKTIKEGLAYIDEIIPTLTPEQQADLKMDFLLGDNNKLIAGCLSLLLYINSDAPDIEGHDPQKTPRYPAPKKVKKGLRLFEAPKRRIIYAGRTIGVKIRAALESDRVAMSSGRTVKPHIRRAHWHGFWRGARSGDRQYSYKWLFPIAVNIEKD